MAALGVKRVFYLSIQSPFAEPTQRRLDRGAEVLHGSGVIGGLIYDKDKTTYRSEIDQALRAKPDFLYLNSYAPDLTILARDLYRAGLSMAAALPNLRADHQGPGSRCRRRRPKGSTRCSPRPT